MPRRRVGAGSPAWKEEEDVDGVLRFWARLLGPNGEDDALQDMRLRWLRYRGRARDRTALAYAIGRSVVAEHLRKRLRREGREESVGGDLLDRREVRDRTELTFEDRVDRRLDAASAVGGIPELLERLRPPPNKPRKLAVFLLKVEVFNRVYGQKQHPSVVAQEVGRGEHWVKECYRDLLRQLAPLIAQRFPPDKEGPSGSAGRP